MLNCMCVKLSVSQQSSGWIGFGLFLSFTAVFFPLPALFIDDIVHDCRSQAIWPGMFVAAGVLAMLACFAVSLFVWLLTRTPRVAPVTNP